jgi:hypothetical protein
MRRPSLRAKLEERDGEDATDGQGQVVRSRG